LSVGILLGSAAYSEFKILQLTRQIPTRLTGELRRVPLRISLPLRAMAGAAPAIERLARRDIAGGNGARLRIGRLPREPRLKVLLLVDDHAPAHGEMRRSA